MNEELMQIILKDLFENTYRAKEKFYLYEIIDDHGNINLANLCAYIRNDAVEFKEMLDERRIPVDEVLYEMHKNYQAVAENGIIYSIYWHCLDLGCFLPDTLKAFATNGLLKIYCSSFLSQFEKLSQGY